MRFSQLVSYTKEFGKRKTDLLAIISSFNSYDLLLRHLSLLSRQTYTDFNAILVLGVPFDDKKLCEYLAARKFPFGIIVAKENERRGCSGAFFTGQKYALEQGYPYAIMADDDCMPVDRELIAELHGHRQKGYVAPTTVFMEGSYRKKGFSAGPSQYSLYSTGIFRKYGLYYLPLFHGADDGEYMERVKEKPFCIKNETEHPYIAGMRLFTSLDRTWLFTLQSLVIMRSIRSVAYTLSQYMLLSAISLFFLPDYGRRLFFTSNRLLLTHTYGRRAGEQMKSGYERWISKSAEGAQTIDEKEAAYIDSPILQRLGEALLTALKGFRKSIVVEKTNSLFKVFFLAATAKKLSVKVPSGGYLLVADHPSLPFHLFSLLLFAIFLPVYALILTPLFLIIKIALQPRTARYGLD